jgi:transcription antitermination factor NusG
MSSAQVIRIGDRGPAAPRVALNLPWYAIQTRARCEKKVAAQLARKGIEIFLPLIRQIHRWSDRRQVVEVPLFPGYGFVQLPPSAAFRLPVLQTAGVTGFVTMNGVPVLVPEQQISDVKCLMETQIPCNPYPYIKSGQRVRIRGGCLDRMEGILISDGAGEKLVVSLESIQRSVSVHIEGYDIEPI